MQVEDNKAYSLPVTKVSVESVQELVRRDSTQVSDKYIRDEDERPTEALLLPHLSSQAPVIDFSLLCSADADELNKLDMACQQWGFFQIINHEIEDDLLQKTKNVVAAFFKLPLEEKQKCFMDKDGLQGYGQFVVSKEQKLDWGDLLAFSVFPEEHRIPRVWPKIPLEYKDVIEEYSMKVNKIAKDLLENLSLIMGVDKNFLKDLHQELMQFMRLNYYPICPRPDQVLGLSPHSDANSITILLQDNDVPGLHIRHAGGWVPIKPIQNALLVNIGDCIEIWSNGKYKSIEHRAVTNKYQSRISIVSFIEPSLDAFLEPLAQMVEGQQQLYKGVKYGEYSLNYLTKKLGGKSHTQFMKFENK